MHYLLDSSLIKSTFNTICVLEHVKKDPRNPLMCEDMS